MPQTQPGKRKGLLKNLVLLAFVAGAAVFVYVQLQKRQLIERENHGIELQNDGRFQDAIEVYQALRIDLKSAKDRARIDRHIADCYAAMAEDPGLSFKEALDLYRKAYAYDPASVTNPAIVKALKASE